MPPLWKIKREIKTLRDQLGALVELCLAPLRQRLSDPKIHELTRVQSGDKALGPKVALFLIYQPNGLSSSVITTCSYLALKGYSVLLISNSALQNHDLQALAPFVWRFVQRVNYGYDFGGYRDGIRLLWAWSVTPDSLLILNDSIWYPLNARSEMIELMENSPAEFLGAIKHVDGGKPDTEHGGFFLSYFFMVKKRLFLSPTFSDFWKSYVATSNKYLTVRRGERGFSKAMFSAGVKSEGVYSKDRFMGALKKATPEDLSLTLKYGAYTDAEFIQQRDRLIEGFESTEAWKLDAISHIESVASKRNFHSSFCYGTIKILGIPFLKKNKGELQIRTRQQYLLAVKAGDLPSPYSLAQSEKLGGEVSDLEWIKASQKMLSEISA